MFVLGISCIRSPLVCAGVYGDVMRVKILFNKKDTALIQFSDGQQAQTGIVCSFWIDIIWLGTVQCCVPFVPAVQYVWQRAQAGVHWWDVCTCR